jgi:hypothetical protein
MKKIKILRVINNEIGPIHYASESLFVDWHDIPDDLFNDIVKYTKKRKQYCILIADDNQNAINEIISLIDKKK